VKKLAFGLMAATLFLSNIASALEFPTLEVAIKRAKEHAIVVAEAQGELGVARAQRTGAGLSSVGNPYTDLQIDKPITDGNGGALNQSLQVLTYTYLPVDLGGQRGKRIEEANQLIAWRKQGIINAEAIATSETVAAYGELLVSSARVVEATSGEATAREEAKYFQGRFEAKDTTQYEKSISEAEVARWVQSKAEAELRVASGRARFETITGTPTDAPPPPASVLPPTLKNNWDNGYIVRVAEKSPVVSRYAAEAHYWDASIERYERERFPPISLELIIGHGSQGEARIGGGATIGFPITRRYQGEIARAEAGRLQAQRQYDLYQQMVMTRLRAARDAIGTVNRALEELDTHGIPALERAVSSSVEAFRAGKVDLTRAMLARRDLAIARARRLDLLEASWRAYADLVIFSGDLP
jgi:cobalt-zinc-cadmium efflux system outer membrane protein